MNDIEKVFKNTGEIYLNNKLIKESSTIFKVRTLKTVNLRVRIKVINVCPCCNKRLLEVVVKNIGENPATKVNLICTFSPVPIKVKYSQGTHKIKNNIGKITFQIESILPKEKHKIRLKVTPRCECTHLMALATSNEPQNDIANNVTMKRI